MLGPEIKKLSAELAKLGRTANPVLHEVATNILRSMASTCVIGSYGSGKTMLAYAILFYYAPRRRLLPLYVKLDTFIKPIVKRYKCELPESMLKRYWYQSLNGDNRLVEELINALRCIQDKAVFESNQPSEKIEKLLNAAYECLPPDFEEVVLLVDELERPYLVCQRSEAQCRAEYGISDKDAYLSSTLFDFFDKIFSKVFYVTFATPGLYGLVDRQVRERMGSPINLDEKYSNKEKLREYIKTYCDIHDESCGVIDDNALDLILKAVRMPRVLTALLPHGITLETIVNIIRCVQMVILEKGGIDQLLAMHFKHVHPRTRIRFSILLTALYLDTQLSHSSVSIDTVKRLLELMCDKRYRELFLRNGLIDSYLASRCDDLDRAYDLFEDWIDSSLGQHQLAVRVGELVRVLVLENLRERKGDLDKELNICIGGSLI